MKRHPITAAVSAVLKERARQIEHEGFDWVHDEDHDPGDLTAAAVCYAANACAVLHPLNGTPIEDITKFWMQWPWEVEWWKPKDPRRDLVRAAALLIAEIEKLDRAK
jgi:hypothetical protein